MHKKEPIAEQIAKGSSWGYLFYSIKSGRSNQIQSHQIGSNAAFFSFSDPFLSTSSINLYALFDSQDARFDIIYASAAHWFDWNCSLGIRQLRNFPCHSLQVRPDFFSRFHRVIPQ